MSAALTAAWLNLSTRDQRIVKIGAVVVAALLFWAWVWDPLAASRAALREQASANETALAWMRPAAEQLAARGGASAELASSNDGRSLLARVDASARSAGLGSQLTGVEPQGEQRVRLQLSSVDFSQLATWLESLAAMNLHIEELSANRAAGSGRVDVRLVITGAK